MTLPAQPAVSPHSPLGLPSGRQEGRKEGGERPTKGQCSCLGRRTWKMIEGRVQQGCEGLCASSQPHAHSQEARPIRKLEILTKMMTKTVLLPGTQPQRHSLAPTSRTSDHFKPRCISPTLLTINENMSDPLSITASIIALLQLANSAAQYLRTVKDASKDCNRLVVEISSLRGILSELSDRFEDENNKDSEEANCDDVTAWSATLPMLTEPGGPLEILNTALQELKSRLEKSSSATGVKKLKNSLLWPFTQNQTEDLLRVIERQKSLVGLALENNHFLLSQAIKEDTSAVRQELRSLHEDVKTVGSGIATLQLRHHGRACDPTPGDHLLKWVLRRRY